MYQIPGLFNLVALGGALGSASRYAVSTHVQRLLGLTFPYGILSVNVIGSFLIGLCWSLAEAFQFSPNTRAFLFTGFFGGFTTFSSFSLDTMTLLRDGSYKIALMNILVSNVLALIAVFLGLILGKNLTSLLR